MATRLLRVVFGFYIVVVTCLTIGQMVVEYWYQKNDIRREFVNIQTSFEHVLAGELWNLDAKALRATVDGMIELPVIVGMKIADENGKIIVIGGIVKNGNGAGETGIHVNLSGCAPEDEQVHSGETYKLEMFASNFSVTYLVNNELLVLGRVTIYSNTSVVLNRVKVGFLMLGVKAIVEIGLLWLIFNLVFVRVLKKPLANLTSAVERVTFDNLDAIKVGSLSGERDEIGVLAESFNKMLLDLRSEISKRKIADENLTASEAKLNSILRVAPAGIGLTKGRVFSSVNPAMCSLTGYGSAELVGQSTRLLYLTEEEYLCGGDRLYELVAQQGIGTIEVSWCRKDGRCVDVLLSVASLIPNDPDGDITFIAIDITERKQAEAALRESEQQYRTLIDNFPAGVVVHGPDTSILLSNAPAASILGLSVEQMRGKTAMDPQWCFLEEDGSTMPLGKYPVNRMLASGEGFKNLLLGVSRPDRAELTWLLCNAFPVKDPQGQIVQAVIAFTDITERKQAAEALAASGRELQAKNAELERFLYTASHDLKSPVVTVGTFLGYLEQDMAAADAGRIAKDLAFIRAAADKMKRLLDDVLELSRVGRVVKPPVRLTFRKLADEALAAVAGCIAERGVTVQVDEHDVTLLGDPLRLAEIWQNLVENACKFMGDQPAPHITIGVAISGAEPVFFVRDNGIGLDPRFHARVFNLFEKLNPKAEGTGLGLALIKRIVELYQGRIWVESSGVGQGTCFYFTLPGALSKSTEGGKA